MRAPACSNALGSSRPTIVLREPRALDQRVEIDAGLDLHVVEHVHEILGDRVARRARRVRTATEAADRRVEAGHAPVERGDARWRARCHACRGSAIRSDRSPMPARSSVLQGRPLHEEILPEGHPRTAPRPGRRPAAVELVRTILRNPALLTAILGAALLIGATAARMLHGPPAVRYVLVGLSFVLAGWGTAIDTAKILLRLRFDIDVLMFAAAFGAAALGHYEEGAFLLVLFAFGGAGEELAMDRAAMPSRGSPNWPPTPPPSATTPATTVSCAWKS